SLRRVDPPGRVLADPSPGSSTVWPRLLRGGDPREPGHRPAGPGATDLPETHQQADPGPVPDSRAYRGSDALAAHRLQAFAGQAVSQGGPRPADRDHDQ